MNTIEEYYAQCFKNRMEAKPLIKKEFKDICDKKASGSITEDVIDFYQRLAKEMLFVLVDDMEIIDMFIHIFK